MAAVKVGNFVRPADVAPLATIIQIAPVYVAFALPQSNLPDVARSARGGNRHHPGDHPGRDAARAAATSR